MQIQEVAEGQALVVGHCQSAVQGLLKVDGGVTGEVQHGVFGQCISHRLSLCLFMSENLVIRKAGNRGRDFVL